MIYKRKILSRIEKYIKSKEILVLTGMRSVGKTTLYRLIFEGIKSSNKLFLDLENPITQKLFEELDYDNVIINLRDLGIDTGKKAYIFLDEIQALPEIVKVIKYLYDHYDIKFFVTGSSSFYLKNVFSESLAGRKYVFEIFPLDFEEFLVFKKVPRKFYATFTQKDKNKNAVSYEKCKKLFKEYMEYGGFPGVILAGKAEEKKMKLNDIFKSYFEKDVKNLADFRGIKALRDLILLLMQRVGSKLEITKLSSEIGVSRETIYSFLSFLEGTYFVHFVEPFSRSVDREISGGKKVYLCDNGILNNFARVSDGALFENTAFLGLRKYGKINYYQKRSGGEIDFVINKEIAVEIKTKGDEADFKKLERIAKSIDIKQFYLVTKEFSKKSKFIPALDI